MTIRFYNTLTRRKEPFAPIVPGEVRMYSCGPTVYNFAHIGNFRAYIFADLLRRHLKNRGYRVTQVMNITDVEDKIIRTCNETGEPLQTLTERYTQAFLDDLDTLGVERAEHYPRATDNIGAIVDLIKRLLDKGYAYEAKGSIYFRLSAFPGYGKLSHYDTDTLRAGASGRVDHDEYGAEDVRDFALWKAYDAADGAVYWDTELGRGRPGWHIECSCMSMAHLGESFDIHTGGVDLIFPHHENEIAQSEAATGKPFVRYWLHNAHLLVEGRKMAKSLGNTYTLRDLLDMGHHPLAIRYVLLATHYRQPNNFTFDALEAAAESLERVRDFRARVQALADTANGGGRMADLAAECGDAFNAALDDDLNISAALAAVFTFIRESNKLLDAGEADGDGASAAEAMLNRAHAVTGLFPEPNADEGAPQEIWRQVLERQEARKRKDFARADAIRDELAQSGWIIEDTPKGPRVKRSFEHRA